MAETLKRTDTTTLNLLTRDGAVTVAFAAYLTGAQYMKLFESIRDYSDSGTELRERVAMLANEWGIDATVDDGA
jgi:hypothetical protein